VPASAVGLVEPIAIAVHAVNRGAPRPGERALVVGAGSIGLLCAAVLRDRGNHVDVAARHATQATAAETIGAGTPAEEHYPLVIDAGGTRDSFATAVRGCDRGGRVVLVSLPWEPLDLAMSAVLREITVIPAIFYGHHRGRDEFAEAAALLGRRPELPAALVTHRFALDQAGAAFRTAGDRAAGAIKVMLTP
jgi:threonine dehydrogenase-like Zn-dependent dehydrogenase